MSKTEIEKILFLDIETVPVIYNYNDLNAETKKLWDKKWQYNKDLAPEVLYQKAGIFAEFAKVICIGLGFYSGGKFYVSTFADADETIILKQFSALVSRNFNTDNHLLCAHNGKEFDFPFLCRRFLINNIPAPKILQIQGKKPWDIKHIDTMELWKFGDFKNFTSLDLLANVFGIPSPKDDIDGSMVAKTFYEDKDLKRIETYCKKDVITLTRVYNRFSGTGVLSDDEIIFA